jgi:hypothetical protein
MPQRLITVIGLFCLLIVAAACQQVPSPDPNLQSVDSPNPIEWDRSPTTVVFRADVTGGNGDPFLARNEVPPCTVYGDNHIVWVNQLSTYETQILEDRVTDDQMRQFINFVALNQQYYSYPPRSDTDPASAISPVVETLTLFVNGVQHETDVFSGWDSNYYEALLRACRDISTAPVLFEPTAAYVSAQSTPYDATSPTIFWDAQANNLNLAELAASGERKWITDRNVRVIWNVIRTSPPTVTFTDGDNQYHVALEVPGITRNAPAAP